MKIHCDDKVQQGMAPRKPRNTDVPGRPTFGEVLRQTVASGKVPERSIMSIGTPAVMRPPVAAQLNTEAYRCTEQMLDAMEHYRQLLGDQQASLKKVGPALRQVRAAMEKLAPLVEAMPEDDPVKGVATRAMVLATKEFARFDGGDYVGVA